MRQLLRGNRDGDPTGNARHHRQPTLRRLLERGRTNGVFPGTAPDQDRHWRQVPKINILARRRATSPSATKIRAVVLLVLLVEAFLLQGWYREQADSAQQIGQTKGRLEVAEKELGARQKSVEALRTQLSQLQGQRRNREQEFQQVTLGHLDWHGVVAALFRAEFSGARFLKVIARPGGEVTLEGEGTGPETVKTLPAQLTGVSDVMDLQSIKWSLGSDPPKFTATFRVRP